MKFIKAYQCSEPSLIPVSRIELVYIMHTNRKDTYDVCIQVGKEAGDEIVDAHIYVYSIHKTHKEAEQAMDDLLVKLNPMEWTACIEEANGVLRPIK